MATDLAPGTSKAQSNNANDMLPAYRPGEVEPRIYERWLDADVFPPDGKGSRADRGKKPFVVTQPPPNITGELLGTSDAAIAAPRGS